MLHNSAILRTLPKLLIDTHSINKIPAMNSKIPESELILNNDGSIYHLHLKPEDLATTVITVGDPDRVIEVSKHFDSIELKRQNREYITHTGYLNNKRISVISTGIGVNSIDIVINELDALVNIDFATRTIKENLTRLDIIRLGTSGTVQADIALDSILSAKFCFGFDNLLHFYQQTNSAVAIDLLAEFIAQNDDIFSIARPYITQGSAELITQFNAFAQPGITLTCEGFYAPQGRALRLQPALAQIIDKAAIFQYQGMRITNLEMETSAIYGLGQALGHRCCSLNAIIANRATKHFSNNSKQTVEKLIVQALDKIAHAPVATQKTNDEVLV